ncbi:CDP-glycerol glycerophosphotransferase family protein [Isoptericola sp. b515]|uniref:bifunctional glycosyltransferase/CDP-glycerol:glycerophosphate glycerophosphotransferase n=1 Tax=Isoptericola sp. b515 TaxID=3064652 RepID=UPI00271275C9|nr:CDP-glycerol glycerophosphotransferase family protein [Isoptericola sp. b515]MDO8149354.1 CDP-glycerol glycerophosphotransferase family protein [Isoptericola sp. b515]
MSVVMPCRDGERFVEAAVRSVLNQDMRDLELIVVDDGSQDRSREIVEALAGRDRRIRPMATSGGLGPGAARNLGVAQARGRYLTFVDADDLVLPGAYSRMLDALRRSRSDMAVGGYLRHGTGGTHRPRLVSRVHREERIGTDARRTPSLLDEAVVWNRVYRTAFWRSSVGPFPEQGNYEDREPALRSALRARSFDLLATEVYSWRLPEGRASRSQHKRELGDLRDRLAVIERKLPILDEADGALRDRVVARWIGPDLGMYAAHVPQADDAYWDLLRAGVARIAPRVTSAVWAQVPVRDRLLAWCLVSGSRQDVEEVLGTQAEDSTAVPLVATSDDRLRAVPEVLDRLGTSVPPEVLDVDPGLLEPEAGIRNVVRLDDRRVQVDGWAYVPGLAPDTPGLDVRIRQAGDPLVLDHDGHRDLLVDVDAGDPWRSYRDAGFRVVLPADGPSASLEVELVLGGAAWVATIEVATPLREAAGLRPDSAVAQGPMRMTVDDVAVHGGSVLVSGTVAPVPEKLRVGLRTSRRVFDAFADVSPEGAFSVQIDSMGSAFPSDGYFLRWSTSADGELVGWARPGHALIEGAVEAGGESQAATVARRGESAVSVTIRPPLTVGERSRYGQRALRRVQDWGPVVPAVLFETFNGKSCGGNPGAIFDDLRHAAVDVPLYWSVRDLSVPVPRGGTPLVIGSEAWHRALATSAVLVNNNNFPHHFEKRAEQFYLQTWHGTPIKRLLWDLPSSAVPLTYRRLMRRQVPMWDLLLAQTESAVGDLRSGLGYDGEVLVAEQPRNAALLAGVDGRLGVRRDLGIGPQERVILYAPTWREHHRTRDRAGTWDEELDLQGLAEMTGAMVLARSHHVSSRREVSGARVKDVSDHGSVEELMLAADVLVSDYSSVLHDWSLLNRPAIVYAHDLARYRDVERGFYGTWPNDIRWPVVEHEDQLVEAVSHAFDGTGATPAVDSTGVTEGLAQVRARIMDRLDPPVRSSAEIG